MTEKMVTIGGVKYKLDNAERYVEKHSILTALYEANERIKELENDQKQWRELLAEAEKVSAVQKAKGILP